MVRPISFSVPESIAKLWCNEVMRVFHDRLINIEDKRWFTEMAFDLLQRNFGFRNMEHDEIFVTNKPYFGDLLKLDAPVRLYEEIKDKAKLFKVLNNQLEDYNIGNTNKMNLVFFEDCIDHILRCARIFRQPRGMAMLIGVGGSGK
jgi:dynein heavy chain